MDINGAKMKSTVNKRRSIATRWFVNSFAAVAVILALMSIGLFLMLRQYYYSAVEQLLQSEAAIISGVLSRYHGSFGVIESNEIRRSIEEFDKKSQMELMAIDSNGEIVLTSSGFSPESYEIPDFDRAKQSSAGTGLYVGYFRSSVNSRNSSEKYMAVTVMLPASTGGNDGQSTYTAIRLVASLEAVDEQIYTFTVFVAVLSIATLFLLLLLGLYFVRSIVSPLRQIGNTAKRLAGGDFSVRITQTKNEDEIGDLCKVINEMADELELSESLKNDFISSVSHELRTPLTAIKGWSETVLELRDDSTTEKGMNVIISETDRLTSMVEELLDFSRIQSGGFTLQQANMAIIEELSEAITVYTERANREGIRLVFDCEVHDYIVYGDKNRIRQVFLNIIDNAIKYSEKGSEVRIEVISDEMQISIYVIDRGHGIKRVDLPKVKHKFFKANNNRRGSGIGLAVADEIVTLHGGNLSVKSEFGKGTTVRISFPLVKI
ncbi:MAG: HAMP domain-containing histidine kinase [Oscillospiraceae bacterium]|nr:HAMP domain-containing histidine kinase [Oscillospiraceae bacterium]